MGFSLEPKVLILRAGKEFAKHGDAFEFVATVTIDKGIAHIQAALGQLPQCDVADFFETLANLGVHKVCWERLKGMQTKLLEFDIKKANPKVS